MIDKNIYNITVIPKESRLWGYFMKSKMLNSMTANAPINGNLKRFVLHSMTSCVFLFCLLGFNLSCYAQFSQFHYKREIKGIIENDSKATMNPWYSLTLPNELFGKMRPDLIDMRIIGITGNKDTIEAPYLLQTTKEAKLEKEWDFRLINSSHNDKGYFFTFEMPVESEINQIALDIAQTNFDWRLKLEGSENQQEWFTLAENYRILAIQNVHTNYHFTNILFSNAKYRYFRICIDSKIQPEITSAKISKQAFNSAQYQTYPIEKQTNTIEKQTKETIIQVELPKAVPVSYLQFAVKNTFDYYRPIKVEYLTNSVKTEKGWVYSYNTLVNSTLSSLEKREIRFENTICKRIKITIENGDNEPLAIDSLTIKGNLTTIVARFTQAATYYLLYGNKNATQASYDISLFQEKIPKDISTLTLGTEEEIAQAGAKKVEPLFTNKAWLWGIMLFVIALLGWFSLRMMRNV